MANITLKGLLSEAEDFKAKSKESGKMVHFKSKDSYQAALKAGTHEDPNAKKGSTSKGDAKPNDMFGGDYSKDRGGETSTKLTSILPKDASDGSTIKIGNTSVKIEYVGKNKDYIAYSWEGDDGESNYEEIKVSDHKDTNSLINRIKDEIRYQRVVVSKRNDTSDGPKIGGEAPTTNTSHTSVQPDSQEVKTISRKTGTREKFIADFINKHKLDASALSKFIENGSLIDRMDVGTAMVGNPGNKYEKDLIKKFGTKDTESKSPSLMGVDTIVYNKRTKTVGIVRMADERGETKTDADGNVNTSELETYNPIKYPHQNDAKVAPSTQKEVDSRGLYNPFKPTEESTKLTSMLKK